MLELPNISVPSSDQYAFLKRVYTGVIIFIRVHRNIEKNESNLFVLIRRPEAFGRANREPLFLP